MTIGNEEVEISPEMLRSMEKEAIEAKKNDEKAKEDELEAKKVDDALNQVESIAADATQNEFYKEQLLQKEKQEKARKDVEKLDNQIQKAEEKLKCMQAEIKKAQDKAEKERLRNQTREEVAEVSAEVQHEVQAVKKTFHNKIDNFAVETDRLKAKKLKQLTELRLQMTKIMIDQQSKGSRSNCLVEKEEAKHNYCNAKFTANWFENNFCRKNENFCGVCCDREFSVSYPEDREKCIYECQLKNGQLKSSNDRVSESNYTAKVETIT
jgi:chromosome segregation ATPase